MTDPTPIISHGLDLTQIAIAIVTGLVGITTIVVNSLLTKRTNQAKAEVQKLHTEVQNSLRPAAPIPILFPTDPPPRIK